MGAVSVLLPHISFNEIPTVYPFKVTCSLWNPWHFDEKCNKRKQYLVFYGVSLEVCRSDLTYPKDNVAFNKTKKWSLLRNGIKVRCVSIGLCLLPVEVNTQRYAVKSKKWICLSGMCSLDLHELMGICVCVWGVNLEKAFKVHPEYTDLTKWLLLMTNAN